MFSFLLSSVNKYSAETLWEGNESIDKYGHLEFRIHLTQCDMLSEDELPSSKYGRS